MKEKRLPATLDFPNTLTISITPPPPSHHPTNILVLLHGLGDTHIPFARLGTQLNLPHTACIAIKAPNPLPFEDNCFHWADDVIFDSSTNGLDPDGGLKAATRLLVEDVISKGLIACCGYQVRDIVLFGLGQGGMVALNVALTLKEELGGVVSIGAGLPSEASPSDPKCATPIIVCSGVDSQGVPSTAEDKLRRSFQHVTLSKYRRRGDTMPKSREEMIPVMQFLASRLKIPAPIGTVEMT